MASTGVKIALIGCVAVVIAGVIAIAVGGYFVKSWFSEKGKAITNVVGTRESDYGKRTAKLKEEYPFTPPSNGVITEKQLQRFLAVRKAMYGIYKLHEAELKQAAESQSFSGAMKSLSLLNDLRSAQVKALEEQKMSQEEYTYIVTSVYKSWLAKGAKEALKHETFSEASEDSLNQAIANIDERLQDPGVSEEEKKVLQKTREILEAQKKSLAESAELKRMDEELQSVPKENIELFTKHQQEIQQYAMAGLEFLGL